MTEQALFFYYRNGCHLCEELASLLYRGWPGVLDRVEWIDVDADPGARELYGARIPVLVSEGQVLCELVPDPACLQDHFGHPANTV